MTNDLFVSMDFAGGSVFGGWLWPVIVELSSSLVVFCGYFFLFLLIGGGGFCFYMGAGVICNIITTFHCETVNPNGGTQRQVSGVYFLSETLLAFILVGNVWGLLPYNYTLSSQFLYIFVFSFVSFVCIVASNLVFHYLLFGNSFFPSCPRWLVVFLSGVEFVSFTIRPITLMLRLGINITTGHIFLGLLGGVLNFILLTLNGISASLIVPVLLCFIFFYFFEVVIVCIQAAVFNMLFASYVEEHNVKKKGVKGVDLSRLSADIWGVR